jgi:nucleoside-diphosphate kinase
MIKPGAVQREYVGEIISRFEKKGVKIVGLKLMRMSRELAEKHYEEHTRGIDSAEMSFS